MITDRATQRNLAYDGVNLSGGTGVGETGAAYRHDERFNVTAGVEGYVGKREGVSAFLSVDALAGQASPGLTFAVPTRGGQSRSLLRHSHRIPCPKNAS